MKKFFKMVKSVWLPALMLGATVTTALFITACDDGVTAENLYTKKKEMMSDYLENRPEFSEYTKVVAKAGRLNLLATYGRYTCFAPTNDAMRRFYTANGYRGVEDMTEADCDTLTRVSLINAIYSMGDFKGLYFIDQANLLGTTLSIDPKLVSIGGDTVNSFCINRSGTIIYAIANDSVENGIVHPVDEVISWSSTTLPFVMRNNAAISIFNLCLEMTGVNKKMQRVKDVTYDARYWRDVKKLEGLYGERYMHVPDERRFGYTAFVVPDSVLEEQYGIKTGHTAHNINTAVLGMYRYACEKYPEGKGETWYGNPDVSDENFTEADFGSLQDERNPLHQLIAYHVMPRSVAYEKLYTNCTICHYDVNPTEWYSTLNADKMFKLEYVYPTNTYLGSRKPYTMYLNSVYDPDRPQLTTRGAVVTPSLPAGVEQQAVNGVYYYIDRLIDYGQDTQDKVFNTRIRMDVYTMFNEAMNYNMRASIAYDRDFSSPNAAEKNYVIPNGYLENVQWGETDILTYTSPRNWFGAYEGDEFAVSSKSAFDVTFRLPRVPSGMYQIRWSLALTDGSSLAQAYVDGMPAGMPFDKSSSNPMWRDINEWEDITKLEGEALQMAKKNLHNHSWYHGALSIRYATIILKDDKLLNHTNSEPFGGKWFHVRRVIYTGYLDASVYHTLRLKSVSSSGGLQVDMIELVPKSVYGLEQNGKGEDDW